MKRRFDIKVGAPIHAATKIFVARQGITLREFAEDCLLRALREATEAESEFSQALESVLAEGDRGSQAR